MNNKTIAQQLNLISKLMELHGESSFRARAYSQAAYKIEKLPYTLDEENLKNKAIPGIGSSIQEVLQEIITEQPISILEELLAQTPEGLIEMMSIKGLGPKKLRTIWQELQIETMGELMYACEENRLTSLKGFGEKTQANILNNIKFLEKQKGWYLFADAWVIHELLASEIEDFSSKWTLVGSMAMQDVTIQKITYLGAQDLHELLEDLKSISLEGNLEIQEDILYFNLEQGLKIEFRMVDPSQLGIEIIKASSSEAWWATFTEQYSLPEIAENEARVWDSIQIKNIPAYLRHLDFAESQAIVENIIPIIEESDIKGIIHSHSTYSDGLNSIKEMALHAQKLGYEYLVMSDHSQSAFYANGLKEDRIIAQHKEIDLLNEELAPFKIFKSIESDILYDGNLDYPEEVLATFDLVIASVHSQLNMNEEKAMERILKAIENPYTRILGHPTGRLLLSRPGYPLDMKKVIDHCKKHHVVIEINAHPRRLDLDWTWIDEAQKAGVMLSINPDAHSTEGISLIKYGVKAAQKGGLKQNMNLSSMSLANFEAFIKG